MSWGSKNGAPISAQTNGSSPSAAGSSVVERVLTVCPHPRTRGAAGGGRGAGATNPTSQQ